MAWGRRPNPNPNPLPGLAHPAQFLPSSHLPLPRSVLVPDGFGWHMSGVAFGRHPWAKAVASVGPTSPVRFTMAQAASVSPTAPLGLCPQLSGRIHTSLTPRRYLDRETALSPHSNNRPEWQAKEPPFLPVLRSAIRVQWELHRIRLCTFLHMHYPMRSCDGCDDKGHSFPLHTCGVLWLTGQKKKDQPQSNHLSTAEFMSSQFWGLKTSKKNSSPCSDTLPFCDIFGLSSSSIHFIVSEDLHPSSPQQSIHLFLRKRNSKGSFPPPPAALWKWEFHLGAGWASGLWVC